LLNALLVILLRLTCRVPVNDQHWTREGRLGIPRRRVDTKEAMAVSDPEIVDRALCERHFRKMD